MQILDSIVTGALMLPDERDRKDVIYGAVAYLATGERAEGLRETAEAMLASIMPALANSRARAEAGAAGGRARAEADPIPYGEIVAHLNERAGTSFRPGSRKTRELIRARWREGYRADSFARVVDAMCAEWGGDPKMGRYLRPETLFGPKFESYLPENRPARGAGEVAGDAYSEL